MGVTEVEQRVGQAAEVLLKTRNYVAMVDVLVELGWLSPRHLDEWRQGRLEYLEKAMSVSPKKLDAALGAFSRWGLAHGGVEPSPAEYLVRSREAGRPLRFTESGPEDREQLYRTHFLSTALSPKRRDQMLARQSKAPDLVVIMPLDDDWKCWRCGNTGELLFMEGPGPMCLECADLDHLVFLPAGDAALSRRAKKASKLSAVVVRFSRARKRYERRGILVEEQALEAAEEQCLADADARARRRERDEERRAGLDQTLVAAMAEAIRRAFPGCPPARAQEIAEHTAVRGSGRVGRSAAGRALDEDALRLAVAASIRHQDTRYDELLMSGVARAEARDAVRDDIERVLERWRRA